jgi:hypothetical protein
MDLLINIDLKKLEPPIRYGDKIMLVGSCFTEHIGNALSKLKFRVLQNPHGILFGPDAVCKSLKSYVENRCYQAEDLFQLNELWNSWDHHSRFSGIDKDKTINIINESQQKANQFLKQADWLIITLGSSYTYSLTSDATGSGLYEGETVANCHRAPAQWFEKKMMELPSIIRLLENTMASIRQFNPDIRIIYTISPVRHIRDGVVENNRSKARLIEAVHQVIHNNSFTYYFPAYELVIDVLRDYRFYDIDLVHPNYPATEFVLEKFSECCIDENSRLLMEEIRRIVTARKHRPFQPDTEAHRKFLQSHYEKTKALQEKHSFLDLKEELEYFKR